MRDAPRLLLLLSVCLCACDDGGGDPSAPDAAPDAALDAGEADLGRVDAAPRDAAPDAGRDAAPLDAAVGDAAASDGALDAAPDAAPPMTVGLVINELMANNEGAFVDDVGETDDWIELLNTGPDAVELSDYALSDDRRERHPLPARRVGVGERVVLFADDTPEQGPRHLPFGLSAGGESLFLWGPDDALVQRVDFPRSDPNTAFARLPDGTGDIARCGWATPGEANGATCGPPPPPPVGEVVEFAPYGWDDPWPFPPQPLALTELALRPAGFVEVLNVGAEPVDLATARLTIAPHAPGLPWPGVEDGVTLAWPVETLAPGARVAVAVAAGDTAALEADPAFEGVVQLWIEGRNFPVDRIDFMRWPAGAALTRQPDASGRHRFCAATTPGAANDACDPLPARPVGDRLRHLRTPGDFAALARGGNATGIESVKFVLDLEGGDAVHLLSSDAWDLHYRFVRQVIDGLPPLDRCDPEENRVFYTGWSAFSDRNYVDVEGRRYLLGTLVHHGGADLWTVEYAAGDAISAAQMRRAFFGAAARVQHPRRFLLRPQTADQLERATTLEGSVPLMDPNAPFRGQTYQPLTETVGYGVLTFVPLAELERAPLGAQVIVVTDQVPNDIALVGGLITEAFQTPLAHVNLLSRNRNTPNMALVEARDDPRLAPYFGQLVRLEVAGGGFEVRPADATEAEAFWESRRPEGPPLSPRLDPSVRGVVDLTTASIDDLPALGAKAAQMGELLRVNSQRADCPGPLTLPQTPLALPVVHSLEHYAASGALDRLAALRADPDFRTDPAIRAAGLAEVRALIEAHPVEPTLLAEVVAAVQTNYGPSRRVRFRSSSNTEDLPGFNGAGLYTSISAQLDDPERSVEDALRTVWASLYLARGYDERDYHNIDQDGVAMGVLIHPAFLSERANGVGISRDVLEPIRSDYYFNVQAGEASVTNPAPGVSTEQFVFSFFRQPRVKYVGRSSLTGGAAVLSSEEIEDAACALRAIHDHFRPLIDPDLEDLWFAMDIEFKLVGAGRHLVVKQARPYSFGSAERPADCRAL